MLVSFPRLISEKKKRKKKEWNQDQLSSETRDRRGVGNVIFKNERATSLPKVWILIIQNRRFRFPRELTPKRRKRGA